jgi:hypothetical protein
LLSSQCLYEAVQTHGQEFFDHWLFEHVVSFAVKYCGPRKLSCWVGGVGGEVGLGFGC